MEQPFGSPCCTGACQARPPDNSVSATHVLYKRLVFQFFSCPLLSSLSISTLKSIRLADKCGHAFRDQISSSSKSNVTFPMSTRVWRPTLRSHARQPPLHTTFGCPPSSLPHPLSPFLQCLQPSPCCSTLLFALLLSQSRHSSLHLCCCCSSFSHAAHALHQPLRLSCFHAALCFCHN